jgi:crotonobetainyl-CoA:carnitine CoA-transferase CaiB-like acyl-CoA transferase
MSSLLEGIRVLEAAMLFNGDYLGMLLGDLGADVIKIESPARGDYLRDMLGQITPHHSPAHIQVNRNKRSCTLDLSKPEALSIFFTLLGSADVFVDGYRGGACDRLGIGYEAQRAVKPDIIYCHCSGFGGRGPYASIPTHGQMMNALAAAIPVRMQADGLVRRVPSDEIMGGTTGGGDGTAVGGLHAALHVAAALWRRDRTGQGCLLDAAGADAVVATGWIGATYVLNEHRIRDRRDLRSPDQEANSSARYQWYETSDGRFVLFCCIEHKFWEKFCRVVGRTDLIPPGEAVSGGPVDFGHGDEPLRRELQEIFRTRTQREWVMLAAAEHLPIGPNHVGVRSLLEDPHIRSRGLLVSGDHPDAGEFTYIGEPVLVDDEIFSVHRPAPRLGQHTEEVLAGIGYSEQAIQELRANGTV